MQLRNSSGKRGRSGEARKYFFIWYHIDNARQGPVAGGLLAIESSLAYYSGPMLLSRHRRRHSQYVVESTEARSRVIARLIVAALALLILWYLGKKIYGLFDRSNIQRTGATLTLEQTVSPNVDVSLQGGDRQRAENNLKLYTGDRVVTRGGANAQSVFFDGTRARLDENTEIALGDASNVTTGQSSLNFDLVDGRLNLAVPGGVLDLEWDGEGDVILTGPVVEVLRGSWPD